MIDGSGNVVATWDLGIPAPQEAALPELIITIREAGELVYSQAPAAAVTDVLDNTLSVPLT